MPKTDAPSITTQPIFSNAQAAFAWKSDATHTVAASAFASECVVMCTGTDIFVADVVEQILTAYDLLRRKHFYYESPERMMQQFFKIASRFIKRFGAAEKILGLAIYCISYHKWWTANAGEFNGFLLHEKKLKRITHPTVLGMVPAIYADEKETDKLIAIVSPSLIQTMSEKKFGELLQTTESAQEKARSLVAHAIKRRKHSFYTALVVQVS